MRIPKGLWMIAREVGRHVLRRPVVGIAALARTRDDRWLLIRRGDTGGWALPGGTLEWGETLRSAIEREVFEETGCRVEKLGELAGVYSKPHRDFRFHAVTVVVHALVSEPAQAPANSLEIKEVGYFTDSELPKELSLGMTDMLFNAREKKSFWE